MIMEYNFEKNRIIGGIDADAEYWKGLENGQFKLPRCSDCGTWIWPAHWRCGSCGSWEMNWITLEPIATVFTWTRSWYAFERVKERAEDVPYVTVLAEVPAANGARIMGVLEGDDKNLRIGARLLGVIQPPSAKSKGYASICWSLVE